MLTRRKFITAAAATGVGAAGALAFHTSSKSSVEYEHAVKQIWRHSELDSSNVPAVLRELVRYATLAPSSHNTQCWKFGLDDQSISILPDYQRRCPIVDPDDHHLFVSLGCAAENLVQAAAAMGFRGDAVFNTGKNESWNISLERAAQVRTPLFEAIPRRQSTRAEFDAKPLSNDELRLLEIAGSGNGVRVQLLTDKQDMENVLDFVVQGNTAQMRDPAFVRELKEWLRFNGGQAARQGDGLFTGSSGNPTVPSWLGGLMFDFFFPKSPKMTSTRDMFGAPPALRYLFQRLRTSITGSRWVVPFNGLLCRQRRWMFEPLTLISRWKSRHSGRSSPNQSVSW